MAYFLAFFAILFTGIYLIGSRIVAISQHRRENTSLKFALPRMKILSAVGKYDARLTFFNTIRDSMKIIKGIVFVLGGIVLLCICTSTYFIVTINKLFFSAMIIARAFKKFGFIDLPFIDVVKVWLDTLGFFVFFDSALLPIASALDSMFNFHIDLRKEQLTCQSN